MILILIGVNRRQYRQTGNILPISCLQVWQVSIPANIPLQPLRRRHIYINSYQSSQSISSSRLSSTIDSWLGSGFFLVFEDICYQYPGNTAPTGVSQCWGLQPLIYNLLIWLSRILGYQHMVETRRYHPNTKIQQLIPILISESSSITEGAGVVLVV